MQIKVVCPHCNEEINNHSDLFISDCESADFINDGYVVFGDIECPHCSKGLRVRAFCNIETIVDKDLKNFK